MNLKTMDFSLPDEVNVIKSFNDYDTISDSDTDSDSDSDSDYSYSSDSSDSDCDYDRDDDVDEMIGHFATLNDKPTRCRSSVIHAKCGIDGSDRTDNTLPLWPSNHGSTRPDADTLSTDEEDFEEDFEDDEANHRDGRRTGGLNDDWYDRDALFRDNCDDDDSSMSRFLRKLHKKTPTVYRVPSAASGRRSSVSSHFSAAREA